MEADTKFAFSLFIFTLIVGLLLCVGIIRYKLGVEEVLKNYFSQCVKISEEKIQCPIPK